MNFYLIKFGFLKRVDVSFLSYKEYLICEKMNLYYDLQIFLKHLMIGTERKKNKNNFVLKY